MDGADAVVFERTFAAPIDDVWAAVTESERLARWFGYYTGDPSDGYVMLTMNAEDEPMPPSRCDIVVCEPPRKLQVRLVDAVGTWNLVAALSESAGVTTATLTQIVDDPKMIENTGPGWEYYLDRLVAAQAGSDRGVIDFADYYPAQRDYYLAIQEAVIESA
ncbi:MAG TPA: SRPBCC family protein [Aldersonia sp.]